MKKNFKVMIFDMDGTLFDTMGQLNLLAQNIMHKFYGIAHVEASSLYKKTSGLPFRYQLEKIFPEHEFNQEASDLFEETKHKMYEKPVQPFPEVFDFLKKWKNSGLVMAVSSNDEIANVKTKIGPYLNYFDEILGHKPGFLKGKDHFDSLKQNLNVSSDDMLFIGDSLHDAKMGHENGLEFVGRIGTFSKEDFINLNLPIHVVHDFSELDEWLNGSQKKES